jgi:hypothetical protein
LTLGNWLVFIHPGRGFRSAAHPEDRVALLFRLFRFANTAYLLDLDPGISSIAESLDHLFFQAAALHNSLVQRQLI